MGLIIDGEDLQVPGLTVLSWRQAAPLRLNMGQDGRPRYTRWVRGIALHTTRGVPGGTDRRPQVVRPGLGPAEHQLFRIAQSWALSTKQAGAHLIVDSSGQVACVADLLTEVAYHAGEVNEVTVGVEIYQGEDAELYDGQLDQVVRLLDFLTRRLGIQRQFQFPYHPDLVRRIAIGGSDVVGIYGHRDVTSNRGPGDPGDAIFAKLREAGYEAFDFQADEDLAAWRARQEDLRQQLGLDLPVDGVPGPLTCAALAQAGRPHGLWVRRPGDEP